jgi:hypothetical protein
MLRTILPVTLCLVCSIAACKKDKHPSKPVVSNFAGSGTFGFADGAANTAQFKYPTGLAVDVQGNVYVADPFSNRIRKITPTGTVSTFAGSGTPGFVNGSAALAQFDWPYGVACDAQSNVYVAELNGNRIRKITPSGDVSTFAGTGTNGSVDGPGTVAQFSAPTGVACDANGNVYVADQGQNRIRKITPSGFVSTLAGSTLGSNDGTGTAAKFWAPTGIACDAQGNVYVADKSNYRIRKITQAGVVTTLAGSSAGFADGNGTAAQFNGPSGVACDAQGNVYVADNENHKIRKITPTGVVTTYAGSVSGFANGDGTAAQFNAPYGIAVDHGNVFVADYLNSRIRKIILQ